MKLCLAGFLALATPVMASSSSSISSKSSKSGYAYTIPKPICAKFEEMNVAGTGEYVNTDGDSISPPTTGDMSITFSLTGVTGGSYPTQTHWREIDLEMNAVCVVKEDQPPFGDPHDPGSAPVCFYEAQMSFCRPWFTFPPGLTPVKIPRDRVVDIEALLSKEQTDPGRRTQSAVRGGDKAVIAEVAESKPEDPQLQKNVFEEVETKQDDVEAVLVNQSLIDEDRDLFEPLKGKYVPYNKCFGKRKGGFTAHGTGSQNIRITGGTGGLFGAFGQIITPVSGINIAYTNYTTGDIEYNFDMGLEICFYRREFGFWP